MDAAPRIALQLYTLRALAHDDLLSVLAQVGALGYDGVETAGLHGVDATAVREASTAAGLTICAAHVGVERFEREPDVVARELATLGTPRIVFPALPAGDETDAVARLERAARSARALGLQPAFHNHAPELRRRADGTRLWEAIVEVQIDLELDLGWAWVAGEDPLSLVDAEAARVVLVHVKDHLPDDRDCPVGDGVVGYATLLPALAARAIPWLVVEQDEPGNRPLEAAARSLAATRSLLGTPVGV